MIQKIGHGTSRCPAEDCSGGSAGRQNNLTEEQIESLPEGLQTKVKNKTVKRCSYCGCVYTKSDNMKDISTVFGFLNDGVMGKGWHEREV